MNRTSIIIRSCAVLLTTSSLGCAPRLSPTFVVRDFSSEHLHPGDVLNLGTTMLVAGGGIGTAQLGPTHVPWRIPVRYIRAPATLLPSEAALLQMTIVTRRTAASGQAPDLGNTSDFIGKHRVALWDALVASMIVVPSSSGRFGNLKLDQANFCLRLKYAIKEFENDYANYDESINTFGKVGLPEVFGNDNCIHPASAPDPLTLREITYLGDLDFTGALTSPSGKSGDTGDFYADSILLNEYRGVVLERAAVKLISGRGDEHLWSLKEWQGSGVCADDSGTSLKIDWVETNSRTLWVAKDSYHNAEIIETGGQRRFYVPGSRLTPSRKPLDDGEVLIKLVIDETSLSALYPSDVKAIGWLLPDGTPPLNWRASASCS
jgi:hypothetical protein